MPNEAMNISDKQSESIYISEEKRENIIHNHQQPLLTLLYMCDRLVSAFMFVV